MENPQPVDGVKQNPATSLDKQTMNIWTLLPLALAYCLISLSIFGITSGGWSALIFTYYWSIILRIFFLVLFLISLYRQSKRIAAIRIRAAGIICVLGAQILAILTNRGDCGDGAGSYSFLDKLTGAQLCGPGVESSHTLIGNFFFVFVLLYIASLIFFLFSIKTSVSLAKPRKWPLYLGAALLLIIIGGGVHTYTTQTRPYEVARKAQFTNEELANQAELTGNAEICESIEEAIVPDTQNLVSQKDLCYSAVAKKNADLVLCGHIKNTLSYYDTADDCRDQIWYGRALASKDIRLCDNLVTEQKKFCLTDHNLVDQRPSATPQEAYVGKDYSNKEYGFGFEYPQEFSIDSDFPINQENLTRLSSRTLYGDYPKYYVLVSAHPSDSADPAQALSFIKNAESGKPVPFSAFKKRQIGSNAFYYKVDELFEGSLSVSYYLLTPAAVIGFHGQSRGVDWTNPNFDTEADYGHTVLRSILKKVSVN